MTDPVVNQIRSAAQEEWINIHLEIQKQREAEIRAAGQVKEAIAAMQLAITDIFGNFAKYRLYGYPDHFYVTEYVAQEQEQSARDRWTTNTLLVSGAGVIFRIRQVKAADEGTKALDWEDVWSGDASTTIRKVVRIVHGWALTQHADLDLDRKT